THEDIGCGCGCAGIACARNVTLTLGDEFGGVRGRHCSRTIGARVVDNDHFDRRFPTEGVACGAFDTLQRCADVRLFVIRRNDERKVHQRQGIAFDRPNSLSAGGFALTLKELFLGGELVAELSDPPAYDSPTLAARLVTCAENIATTRPGASV